MLANCLPDLLLWTQWPFLCKSVGGKYGIIRLVSVCAFFCSNHVRALASSGSHLAVLGAGKTFASLLAYNSSRACLHDSGLQVRCNRARLLVFIQSQLAGNVLC